MSISICGQLALTDLLPYMTLTNRQTDQMRHLNYPISCIPSHWKVKSWVHTFKENNILCLSTFTLEILLSVEVSMMFFSREKKLEHLWTSTLGSVTLQLKFKYESHCTIFWHTFIVSIQSCSLVILPTEQSFPPIMHAKFSF